MPASGTIPRAYTCDGADRTPPLAWSGLPAGTRELVLMVEDPDAPGGTFVHWALAGIRPPAAGGDAAPTGVAGENSFGKRGWNGPCPPKGDEPHRYRFLLYALPGPSGLKAGASPKQFRAAIARAKPLARGVLEGRYGR